LRRTDYDHDESVERYRASGIPAVEEDVATLLDPPTRDEVVTDAEIRVFAG
jgi:hypothetical protein